MKNLRYLLLIIAGIALVQFNSCEEEEEYQDFYLVDISQDSDDWDVFAFSKDGSSLLVEENGTNIPANIFYTPEKDAEGYPIFLNDEGYPEMTVIDDHIFVFRKVDDTHVDVAMITPDGEMVITRDIETEIDWSEMELKSGQEAESWGGAVRWAGRAASLVGCALSVKAAIATGGVAIPLAKWGCGTMVVSFAAQAVEANSVGLGSDVVGLGVTLVGCTGDPVGCVLGIGSFASGFIADALDAANQQQTNVSAAHGALMGGHGDVQVTLTWNNVADIDLHVVDPTGFEIYYAASVSPSGGELDYDNTDAYGPENIYWGPGAAPSGTYSVYVNHYSGSNPSQYTVVINAFGFTKTFTGTVNIDQKVHITDFSPSGIGNKSAQLPITMANKLPKN